MGSVLHARAASTLPGPALETGACAPCDAKRALPRFQVEGVASRLVLCEDCGLGRFHPVLDAEEIRAL
jgi:hypothetical protein